MAKKVVWKYENTPTVGKPMAAPKKQVVVKAPQPAWPVSK